MDPISMAVLAASVIVGLTGASLIGLKAFDRNGARIGTIDDMAGKALPRRPQRERHAHHGLRGLPGAGGQPQPRSSLWL